MSTVKQFLNHQVPLSAIPLAADVQVASTSHLSAYPAVSVIMPAYNEEVGVTVQVESVRRVLDALGMTYEVVVIDDGSTDQTAKAAVRSGVRVLQHSDNRGYGSAIKTGILAAQFETIVIVDADGTYPADQISELVSKLANADMVVGARVGNEVHVPRLRRIPKWFLRWLAIRIAGKPIPDLNSGMRAFRRDCVLQYFPVLSNQFSFTTTVTLALLADGYRVIYHPIDYYRRVGKSKITPWHFMDFTMLVLRMAMLFQPMKIFVPAAFICSVLGVVKVGFDIVSYFLRTGSLNWSVVFQPVLSTSAILLLLVGFQLLLIGMLADGVLRRIAQRNAPLEPSHGIAVLQSAMTSQQRADEAAAVEQRLA